MPPITPPQHTAPRARLALTLIALCASLVALSACGDDGEDGGAGTSTNNATTSTNAGTTSTNSGTSTNAGTSTNNSSTGTNNGTSTSTNNATSADAGDTGDLDGGDLDAGDEDVVEDVVEDTPPDVEEYRGGPCALDEDCDGEGRLCVENVCSIVPDDRTFVELNYVLEEPEELAPVVSVIKGFLSNTGFFMTRFDPIDDDTIFVTYGGGDRVESVEDGPDIYAWQIPDETVLPTFTLYPYQEGDDPEAGDSWQSEIFDYRLVAAFEFNGVRSGLGFEAKESQVLMTFNNDGDEIINGVIEGFMTREEAEGRRIELGDDCGDPLGGCCLLSIGVCQTFDCETDEPLTSVADVLDCNGASLDSDVDPDIEGHDAYRVVINFQSELVTLQAP